MIRTLIETREGRVTVNESAEGVTVTITHDSGESTQLPSRNLYTDEKVAELQASEAKLVAEPLRRQVAELEAGRAADHEEIVALRKKVGLARLEGNAALLSRIRELENDRDRQREATSLALNDRNKANRELSEFRRKAEEFKVRAYDQNERAAENQAWAERAEANGVRLSESLVAAEKSLAEATTRAKDTANRLAEAEKDIDTLSLKISKVSNAVHSPAILSALRSDWRSWTEAEAVALANAVRATRLAIGSPEVGTTQA
jgi:chromosome segregation ATPase